VSLEIVQGAHIVRARNLAKRFLAAVTAPHYFCFPFDFAGFSLVPGALLNAISTRRRMASARLGISGLGAWIYGGLTFGLWRMVGLSRETQRAVIRSGAGNLPPGPSPGARLIVTLS
jgi:hypothetical protein